LAYLDDVLASQDVPELVMEMLRTRRELLESSLRGRWACGNPRFYYGGSLGKKTMIASQFDLDLVVYFPATATYSGLQIFELVERRLREAGHAALRHNVAIRLQYVAGFHVDVVPGTAVDDSYEYARLWAIEAGRPRLTSIRRHIRMVRESGQRDVIRLLKLWRWRHRVPVGSFALELATMQALGSDGGGLEDRFRRALEFLRDRFMEARLVDPANPENDISEDLDYAAKRPVVLAATQAAGMRLEEIVW
jgi:hypothetical protein